MRRRRRGASGDCPHLVRFLGNPPRPRVLQRLDAIRAEVPTSCHVCRRISMRLFRCILCPLVGCHTHMLDHFRSTEHRFALCSSNFTFLCGQCGGYVLNDGQAREIVKFANPALHFADVIRPPINAPFRTVGLRGIVNLGSTCFMNSVLQALAHNPLLRNFYLGISQPHPSDRVSRLLKKLLQELYCGDPAPFNPHEFLYTMWCSADHLSGYKQQDAHEFAMAILNAINGSRVVDFVFGGRFRSVITCQTCGDSRNRVEPFIDVSLCIKDPWKDHGSPMTPTPAHRRMIQQRWDNDRILSTLNQCLDRYTNEEDLDSRISCSACRQKSKAVKQLTFDQLPLCLIFHFKRFEVETGTVRRRKSLKIDHYIQFPLELDIYQYCSGYLESEEGASTQVPFDEETEEEVPRSAMPNTVLGNPLQVPLSADVSKLHEFAAATFRSNRRKFLKKQVGGQTHQELYSLFAVVSHSGTIENGHYTVFVRHEDRWFLCDDQFVFFATEEDVKNCQAYLLFYCKKELVYC